MPTKRNRPVTAVVVGAGGRGMTYAEFAQEHPDRLQITGVAEPKEYNREKMARLYNIPSENVFKNWQDLAERPRMADAAIIATQDALHVEPAVALAGRGYSLLLEKPMAPDETGCRRIVEAVTRSGVLFSVCHVLRYTHYTQMLKKILLAGTIGEVISIQHLEPVGYWHQAHSFVRGNWRNEKESSFMLLAKSCHDLDWMRYVMDAQCRSVSSFGSLIHFRKDQKPAEAGDAQRCLECAYESRCPYSAKKLYLGMVHRGALGWPVNVLDPEPTEETITSALRHGPYGRCVYECDNDVVDNQVVNLLFDKGKTGVFTMTAFNKAAHRKTRLFGTLGEIYGDGVNIEIFDFLNNTTRKVDTTLKSGGALGGHGGGDYGLMDHFVAAVAANDPGLILSGPAESLETHRMVFAAERARREHKVVDLDG